EDGKLYFRKSSGEASRRSKNFKKGEDLLSFNPKVKAATIPTEVLVQGWDPAAMATIKHTAGNADAGPTLGSETQAVELGNKLAAATKQRIHRASVRNEAEATEIAKSAMRAAAQNVVEAIAT